MRLTAFTDYGLRILMRLASAPDRLFTTDGIAREMQVSRNHLAKVVQDLAGAGYIRTRRGAGGGFRLAVEPQSLTIGEVARVLERRYPLVECFRGDGGSCTLTPRCRLKARLAAARETFFTELDATTLAECVYSPLEEPAPGRVAKRQFRADSPPGRRRRKAG